MTEIRVDHPDGPLVIHTGDRVTFGRAAMVRLTGARGQKDLNLHAEAFGLSAEETGWVVDVAEDHREVVVTEIGGRGKCERVQGERKKFYWAAAEITVTTQLNRHRVTVNASVPRWPPEPLESGTTAPAFEPDLHLRADRLLIALCRDRLNRIDAPAVPFPDAIAALSAGPTSDDRDINYNTAKTEVHRRLDVVEAAIANPVRILERFERRLDAIVDWLVATNSVTRRHYDAVCRRVRP